MSDKQHVGAQSDALPVDEEREALRARMAAQRAAVRPSGKRFTGVSTLGDGDWCEIPGHGRKYLLDRGQWCPHADHTSGKLYHRDTAGEAGPELPDLSYLDLQVREAGPELPDLSYLKIEV